MPTAEEMGETFMNTGYKIKKYAVLKTQYKNLIMKSNFIAVVFNI